MSDYSDIFTSDVLGRIGAIRFGNELERYGFKRTCIDDHDFSKRAFELYTPYNNNNDAQASVLIRPQLGITNSFFEIIFSGGGVIIVEKQLDDSIMQIIHISPSLIEDSEEKSKENDIDYDMDTRFSGVRKLDIDTESLLILIKETFMFNNN